MSFLGLAARLYKLALVTGIGGRAGGRRARD
jgi:hypothetical protein